MFSVNLTLSIISAVFLIFLLVVSKSIKNEERLSNLFSHIVFVHIICTLLDIVNLVMLWCVSFTLDIVIKENQWLMAIKNVLSCTCSSMFYSYILFTSGSEHTGIEKMVRWFQGTMGILVLLEFISLMSNNVYTIQEGHVVPLWGKIVSEYVGFFTSISMFLVLLVVTYKKQERPLLISFVLHVLLGVVSLVVNRLTGVAVFSISATFSLMVIFIFVQLRNINISHFSSVENALKEAEETNAMLEKSYTSLEYKNNILYSMSKIYKSAYLIDMEKGWYEEIGVGNERIQQVVGKSGDGNAQESLNQSARNLAAPDFVKQNLEFVDLSTLSQRMRGKRVIFSEGLNNRDKWIRYSFVRVGEDLNQDMTEVVYTSLDIEEQKREGEKQIWASRIDELTKTYNRTAYVVALEELETKGIGDDLWYVSVDINGLKNVNNSLGLAAGDQVVEGTASCLRKVFGHYGNIYRTSGNTFAVILRGEKGNIDRLMAALDVEMNSWKGNLVDSLSFAKGCVCSNQIKNNSMLDISKEADRRMREDKEIFYDINRNA